MYCLVATFVMIQLGTIIKCIVHTNVINLTFQFGSDETQRFQSFNKIVALLIEATNLETPYTNERDDSKSYFRKFGIKTDNQGGGTLIYLIRFTH